VPEVLVGDVEVSPEGREQQEVDLPLQHGGFLFLDVDPYRFLGVGPDRTYPDAILRRGNERTSRPLQISTWRGAKGLLVGPVRPGVWTVAWDGPRDRWSGEVEVRAGELTPVARDGLERTRHPPADGG